MSYGQASDRIATMPSNYLVALFYWKFVKNATIFKKAGHSPIRVVDFKENKEPAGGGLWLGV